MVCKSNQSIGNRAQNDKSQSAQSKRSLISYSLLLILASTLFLLLSSPKGYLFDYTSLLLKHRRPGEAQNSSLDFHWESITPKPRLEFHQCFSEYQCARLKVPLDWSSPIQNGDPMAAIAIIKRPAAVEVTDKRYQGPILFNPGGAGLSGVNFLLQYGSAFEAIFDPKAPVFHNSALTVDDEKYFDLISFDPRGINNTTPRPDCISNPLKRQIWDAELNAIGTSFTNGEVLGNWLARSKLHSKICSDPANDIDGLGHVAKYMSTAQVVYDMIEIIEQHGCWRAKRAQDLVSASGLSSTEKKLTLARTMWRKGEEKLQYWGFSYGTLLGQTFASMRPERVGRMVLDGVMDAEDYISGNRSKNIDDVDLITANFGIECFRAGPTKCEMYHKDGPDAISTMITRLIEKIKKEPATTLAQDGSAIVITSSDVIETMFQSWYNGYYGFPSVSRLLSSIEQEDYAGFVDPRSSATSSETSDASTSPDPKAPGKAVECTDADEAATTRTGEDMRSHVTYLSSISPLFGPAYSRNYMQCAGYTVRAKLRYGGPFGAITSNPILFASPSLDPVTPFRNAVAASQLFPGSGVLKVVGGMGHCTISMPSLKGLAAIRRYFVTGELPSTDFITSVPASVVPFEGLEKPDEVGDVIWNAVKILAMGFPRLSIG